MRTYTWETTVESKSGVEYNIKIEQDYCIENDGIGAYEYWGAKGYDKGTNYAVPDGDTIVYLLRKDGSKFKPRKLPKKFCDNYTPFQTLIGEYFDDHQKDIMESNEPDYDSMIKDRD